MRFIPRILFTVAPFFSACRSTSSTLDIVGGKLVRADELLANHAIALVDTGERFDEYCTAVLIAKGAALTAAHCFLEKKERPALFFGNSIPSSRARDDARFVDFKEVIIHPDFSEKKLRDFDRRIHSAKTDASIPVPKEGLDDLAVILFQPPMIEGFEPASIAEHLPLGQKTTSAGFGCVSTECDSYAMRLRKVELTFLRELGDSNMILMNAGENKGTCAGDSGGPDFMDVKGQWKLLSIVSTGPDSCEAGLSIETRVEPYREWIESITRKR